jgi:hypothetical protein
VKPAAKNKMEISSEGPSAKEDFSRKDAKGAKEKQMKLCGLGLLARG